MRATSSSSARRAELYAKPANVKVAQFIGSPAINLLPGAVGAGGAVELLGRRLPIEVALPAGSPLTIGIRPEAIAARPATAAADGGAVGCPRGCGGARTSAPSTSSISISPGADLPPVIGRAPAQLQLPADGHVALTFDATACHLFDAAGARVAARDARGRQSQGREPVVVPFRS